MWIRLCPPWTDSSRRSMFSPSCHEVSWGSCWICHNPPTEECQKKRSVPYIHMEDDLLTLCSLFVILFLINFSTPWNSFAGPTIRLSINSSSGPMVPRSSSAVVWYASTALTVAAASGCLPIRSYSPEIGLNNVAKCCANPAPEVKRSKVTD